MFNKNIDISITIVSDRDFVRFCKQRHDKNIAVLAMMEYIPYLGKEKRAARYSVKYTLQSKQK